MEFHHIPVLLEETISGLCLHPDGIYVDATIGGGGHAAHIAKSLTTGRLIGVDQDPEALVAAQERLHPWMDRVTLVHDNFRNLGSILEAVCPESGGKVDGILMDLGVSSHQLDEAKRGFSYHEDAPLDMRMDQQKEMPTARDIVNQYSEEELTRIFYDYGEERWSRRIAQFIVLDRKEKPIVTTSDLVTTIRKAIPKKVRLKEKHPARRVFQALRIEVNHELDILQHSLKDAVDHLVPGGRIAVITFHSLEDRLVKKTFRFLEQGPELPSNLPVRASDYASLIRNITKKPITARADELLHNSRARSAKLRIAERLGKQEG